MFKNLLNAIHDVVKGLLHAVLVPVRAALKAIIVFLSHIEAELEKI